MDYQRADLPALPAMGKKPVITQAEYETLAAFRHALRQFLRFSEDAALAAGIAPQQHQALLAIRGFAGPELVTIADLAESLQIRHHSAVGLVDRLVWEGLVKRTQSSDDRRRIHLALTAKGQKILEKLSAAHKEQLLHLMPDLSGSLKRLSGK